MIRVLVAVTLAVLSAGQTAAQDLPAGFVRLSQVAPDIVQDIRYAGPHNFTGSVVPGYEAAECILTDSAARALIAAEAALQDRGLGLVVYDCYRPVRAVAHFVDWAQGTAGPDLGAQYFPGLSRADLFRQGYIARRSGHSLGGTVDVGLRRTGLRPRIGRSGSQGCAELKPADPALIPMGSGFDCFSPLSGNAANLPAAQRDNRKILAKAMQDQGFKPYSAEWWHFRLPTDPARGAMDFPVR